MKFNNLNSAVLILLLHASLIVTGLIVAYCIPLTEHPSTSVGIPLESLFTDSHSDAELLSWLKFLELPHEETLIGRGTLAEALDDNEALGTLDFFSTVEASDRVDYLADRISLSAVDGVPNRWKITLQDASREEAHTLLRALHFVQQQKFSDQAATYDPPIELPHLGFGGMDSISPSEDRLVQLGKACPPVVGALMAVILGMVAWSLCMPGQRKLPMAASIGLLLISTSMLSFVCSGVGYLYAARSGGQWESELAVQVGRRHFEPPSNVTPETQSLIEMLKQKVLAENFLSSFDFRKKRHIEAVAIKKGMTSWASFQRIFNTSDNETDEDIAVDPNMLCDYIIDKFEIEKSSDTGNVYIFRFRNDDEYVSRAFLEYFVEDYRNSWAEYNKSGSDGGPLTFKREINRLSNLETRRVSRSWTESGNTLQGALIGAIFSLVTISSTRVFAGSPPV